MRPYPGFSLSAPAHLFSLMPRSVCSCWLLSARKNKINKPSSSFCRNPGSWTVSEPRCSLCRAATAGSSPRAPTWVLRPRVAVAWDRPLLTAGVRGTARTSWDQSSAERGGGYLAQWSWGAGFDPALQPPPLLPEPWPCRVLGCASSPHLSSNSPAPGLLPRDT